VGPRVVLVRCGTFHLVCILYCGCINFFVICVCVLTIVWMFRNIYTCICCVLYCLYCVFVLLRLCIYIFFFFVTTSVKTIVTK